MPETTENHDLIETAKLSVGAQHLEPGIYYDGFTHQVIDIRAELHEELERRPDRKRGGYTVTDVPSFVDYLGKHALPETELWANVTTGTVRAVINAHQGAHLGDEVSAGHEDHTATLHLATTDDWKDWTARDGKLATQLDFAEFIEDHLPNFVSPSAADMLELAQTFQATTKVDFESSQRVKSGETQLRYVEQQSASAGKKGGLAIPDTFDIALQPFEGSPLYKVQARFRYRISDGHLALGYRLTRPKDVRKTAFDDVVAQVSKDADRAIWATS
ncbi:DUF2303 family protein [Terrabacter sp. NPDC000476]|uniref:DUF2303 family protein n=1 Tax=Terrabacter sp. NPDC000476 TaxID=3154258 RepID=UPI00332A931D